METTPQLPSFWHSERTLFGVGAALLALSLLVRFAGYHFATTDYIYFVAQWFNDLKTHPGFTSFQYPFADYAPLYLYALKFLTWLPVSSLYSSKTLSLIFDAVLGWYAGLIVEMHGPGAHRRGARFFVFALFFAIPTVVLNSSVWGQSDSIYAAAVIACLYYMLERRPTTAAVAFGLALSLKIQAIFFLPVYVGWCLRQRRGLRPLLLSLLLPPFVYAISILPAWVGGGSYGLWFTMYLHEAGEYKTLAVSAQSIFAFVTNLPLSPGATDALFWVGIALTLGVALGVAAYIARVRALPPERLVLWGFVCVLAMPYLLPRMHERYFYLADIMSVLFALYRPKRWYVAIAVVGASLLSYMPFLSGQVSWFALFHVDLRLPAFVLFVVLIFLVVLLWRERSPNNAARVPSPPVV